jgi:predicted ATPase
MSLGLALTFTKGFAVPEVERAYTRAYELCQQIEETPQLFPVLIGLITFSVVRGKLQTARELAEQSLRLAQQAQAPALLLEAHRILAGVLLPMGDLAQARTHLEQGLALYDPRQHHAHAFLYGHDPGVFCLLYLATVLWHLGYPDQARQKDYEALTLAKELGHPFTLTAVLNVSALTHQHRREEAVMWKRIEAMEKIATEYGFLFYLVVGNLLRAWALTEHGQVEEGIAQMQQCLAAMRATGMELLVPYWLLLLAEAHRKGGQVKEGLEVVAEALATVERTGEHWWEAELYRLRGELTLQSKVKSEKWKEEKQKSNGKRQKSQSANPQSPTPNPQAEAEASACFL